ncbi:MAG TPA: flagellin [Anaerolineae bacterium]|nr:flagellin [Anaerolineae bacterium]
MATIDFTRINTNIAALNALNTLWNVNRGLATAQTRLATGKRINEAADDPAGLTMATTFKTRSEGLQVALNSIGDAKNLLAVAEGGLSKINDILGKMRAKAEMAVSDTLSDDERNAIYNELDAYEAEIDDIASNTLWNGRVLLDGSGASSLTFQTGAESGDTTVFQLTQDHSTGSAGLNVAISSSAEVGSSGSAQAYLSKVESAIDTVSSSLATVGDMVARLTFKEETLSVEHVNTEAAFNRIMNADMAKEQLISVKYQILQQTAIAMLAQANAAPQALLQLFR